MSSSSKSKFLRLAIFLGGVSNISNCNGDEVGDNSEERRFKGLPKLNKDSELDLTLSESLITGSSRSRTSFLDMFLVVSKY